MLRNEAGSYILHRMIREEGETYLFCGDNRAQTESIPKSAVLAVVSEYRKKGKKRSLNSLGYRCYRMLLVRFFCLRKYYIALRRWLGRIRRGN